MSKLLTVSVALCSILAVSTADAKTMEAVKIVKTEKGDAFASPKGMTLYTFDKDTKGKSECTLLCAAAWPPLIAAKGEKAKGNWSLVKRDNGSEQWAFKGSPVYTYALDMKPGSISGDGVEGTWHIAKP